jgi:hypothetical protein
MRPGLKAAGGMKINQNCFITKERRQSSRMVVWLGLSGFRVRGSGFRVQGSGAEVKG